MKNKKRIPMIFSYRNIDSFADYLSDQAQKGWHLCEFRLGVVFERGTPEERVFAVEIFPDGSENDLGPTWQTEEYAQYCEAAGWKFVDSVRKICVFERIRNDALPIVTPEERLENVSRAAWQKLRGSMTVAFLWVILQGMEIFGPLNFYGRNYFLSLEVMLFLFWLAEAAFCAVEGVSLLVWRRKQKKKIAGGGETAFRAGKAEMAVSVLKTFVWVAALLAVIGTLGAQFSWWVAAVVAVFILLMCVGSVVLAFFRPVDGELISVILVLVLTVVVSVGAVIPYRMMDRETSIKEKLQEMPLTPADYGEQEGEVTQADYMVSGTVFGNYEYGDIMYRKAGDGKERESARDQISEENQTSEEEQTLHYEVYKSPYAKILDRVWEKFDDGTMRQADSNENWRAVCALWEKEDTANYYLIRYDGAVLFLRTEGNPLTKDQIDIVREKLGL